MPGSFGLCDGRRVRRTKRNRPTASAGRLVPKKSGRVSQVEAAGYTDTFFWVFVRHSYFTVPSTSENSV